MSFSTEFQAKMHGIAASGGMTPQKAVSALEKYLSNSSNGCESWENDQMHYVYKFPGKITRAPNRGECLEAMFQALIGCGYKEERDYSRYESLDPGQFMFVKETIMDHEHDGSGCFRDGGCPTERSTCAATDADCKFVIVCK